MSEERVRVPLGGRSYDIIIGSGLLARGAELLRSSLPSGRAFIAMDGAVEEPHGALLADSLRSGGLEVATHALPSGEEAKCAAQLHALWDALATAGIGRDGTLVALGGGVAGDLAGFAAATWLRGINFIQVPTTLLAMVDSSVGGKTGINHASGKNLLGAFWQPSLVLADLAALATLPDPEVTSALAEVIKYGVISDADFFAWLEEHIAALRARDTSALRHAVRRSCELKAGVVSQDEREGGLREILNFGHTIGHAIEKLAGYGAIRHGEAVAIGMVAESLIATQRGGDWGESEHARLEALLAAAGLPTRLPAGMDPSAIIDVTRSDKKARAGRVRYALPTAMGAMERTTLEDGDAARALDQLRA